MKSFLGRSFFLLFALGYILHPIPGSAQKPKHFSASEIQLQLGKLNVLGSVLYLAAHPDDENQRVITYMANEKLLRSAYLSLTRGDGGQNLVGPEIRELLGVIRTQELLQARRVDGGQQFFSRANDFGYSKTADETLTIWDREKVLSDVVLVIRKFRPDVIITRFPPDQRAGHGHHTSSAVLAKEAFHLANDPAVFPEQLNHVDPWQPRRVFWNTHPFFFRRNQQEFDSTAYIMVDLNPYNPLLGRSYSEIAAESRTMHKSQGFGSTGSRGSTLEFFGRLEGEGGDEELVDGIDFSWNRVEGGEKVMQKVEQLIQTFDPQNLTASVPGLLELRGLVKDIDDSFWRDIKLNDIDQLIAACMGLYLEATASESTATPGEQLELQVEAVNRSGITAEFNKIEYQKVNKDSVINRKLSFNQKLNFKTRVEIPADCGITQPYWLKEKGSLGMYNVTDPETILSPENPPALMVTFYLSVAGINLTYNRPVVYKRNDPVDGETYRPFVITPPVYVNIDENVIVFANGKPKAIKTRVKSGKENITGNVSMEVPAGWKIEPSYHPFSLGFKGEEKDFDFLVYPPSKQNVGELQATVELENGEMYDKSLVNIDYDHIPYQTLVKESSVKIVKLDIEKSGESIGYIMGAGDDIPASLGQIGYQVDLLEKEDMDPEKLKKYDAIILGIRAYNTVDRLKYDHVKLLEYVKTGGTLIVQYNTARLVTEDIAPYALKISRDRVSDETAPVKILNPDHPVMNVPNKITQLDFEDWVQERGLYFPNEWNENFEAILSSHDPGEDPKNGGLLVAQYGKGYYVYTGYSWFRELPAGVPGAYRIFTNMISIGKNSAQE